MKKKIKMTLSIIAITIVIAITGIVIIKENSKNKKDEQEWNNEFSNVNKNETSYNENVTVEQLKEEMKMEADNDLYEITEEYDGRKTLNIKADILYKVAFAGIIKQSKPNIDEIDSIFNEKYPTKNGIWVSKQSRDKFLQLLKENTNSEYKIDEEGYLITENVEKQNENDKKINEIIKSNKRIIIDINSYDYEVDTVTGEVVEYPFEQLDAYQFADILTIDNNDKIIVITTNKKNKLTSKDIITDLMNNI